MNQELLIGGMEPGARVLSNYLSSRSMYSSIIHQSTSNDLLLGAPIFFRLVLSNLWSLCDPSFLSVPTYILINFDSSGCGVAPKFQNSGALADALEGNFWTQHMHMTRRNFKCLGRLVCVFWCRIHFLQLGSWWCWWWWVEMQN